MTQFSAPPGYPPVYPPPSIQYPPAYPQPTYAPPPMYPPAPAGYPQQYPAAPPAPPLAPGSIDQFYGQRSSGGSGPSIKFPTPGTLHVVQIARPITNGDVRQASYRNVPSVRQDGSPIFEMVVPVLVAPSQTHPEGRATWYVKGQARDELSRAMAEAHAPEGPPEAGATIAVLFTQMRSNGNANASREFAMTYARPGEPLQAYPQMPGGQPAPAYQPIAPAQPQYAPPAPPAPAYVPPAAPAYVPPPVPQFVPPAAPAVQQAPAQVAPAAPGMPAMTAEQQQFYAQLTQQGAPA